MKRILSALRIAVAVLLLAAPSVCPAANPVVLVSPDGRLEVELRMDAGSLGYAVRKDGNLVYTLDSICVNIGGTVLPAGNAKVGKTKRVRQRFSPVVPLKFSEIEENYNETFITFGKNVCIILRVMNNGVAYRFAIDLPDEMEVLDDHFALTPAEGFTAHYQTAGSFNTSYEEAYRTASLEDWAKSDRRLATIPLLLSGADDVQLLIGESDVDDYPRQFLTTDGAAIVPLYPKAPLRWEPRGDRGENITGEAPYIAKTTGQRDLPWRWVVVTDSRGLIEQTVPAQLARRAALQDTQWIEPGQVSWEWWNGATPFGPDVDFKAGCNYETYCYFADFAAKFGLRYILLDEGWAKDTRDPFTGNDNLHLPELIRYCKAKNVEPILWLPWLTVEHHLDSLFSVYEDWGIRAVKIDFMDHADQWMVNFYKRVVQKAAEHRIIVDYHGAFTPAGLEYEYPNLVSYEGVRGLEQMGSCRPENTIFIPFIRNAVGAADFTPGGMNNMQPKQFHASRPNSGAMGTRVYQMALYVVLESGLQMLADNPTRYYQNEDCTRFIAGIPATWDETIALEAQAGEYVIVAKRKGTKWFIGGITNGTERDFCIKTDFLPKGNYRITAFKDGINANYQAMHYNKEEQELCIDRSTEINIHMACNGGWFAVVEPE